MVEPEERKKDREREEDGVRRWRVHKRGTADDARRCKRLCGGGGRGLRRRCNGARETQYGKRSRA